MALSPRPPRRKYLVKRCSQGAITQILAVLVLARGIPIGKSVPTPATTPPSPPTVQVYPRRPLISASQQAFVCPGPGLFPHPSCDKFYSCDHGIAHEMSCPPTLFFNPQVSVCDFPPNVNCGGATTTTTTTTNAASSSEAPIPTGTPGPSGPPCSDFNIATIPQVSVRASSFIFDESKPDKALRPLTTVCDLGPSQSVQACIENGVNLWHSQNPPPQWLEIDFGSKATKICSFSFGSRLDNTEGNVPRDAPMDYELQFADSYPDVEESWTTLSKFVVMRPWSAGDKVVQRLGPQTTPHRYWRLLVTRVEGRPDNSFFVVIRDLQMFPFGDDTVPTQNPCTGVFCYNGGQCQGGQCICPSGYDGPFCQNSILTCQNINCLNGGQCNNGVCICVNDYSGTYCEISPDPCRNIYCLNGGNCKDGLCSCINGFVGSFCEAAPNSCQNIVCFNGGNCNQGVCNCVNGYSGTRCKIAPNTCANINCLNGGVCQNGECNCINDFSGTKCEIAPNACNNVNCKNGGICQNGECYCINGYLGTRCEIQPNSCANLNCLNGGVCQNGECYCIDGFSGTYCETLPDLCQNVHCFNDGICNAGICFCVNSYSGTYCGIPPDLCRNVYCLNGGTCNDGVCSCVDNYYGVYCEFSPDPCSVINCFNAGYCKDGSCVCINGYLGKNCEVAPNLCLNVDCGDKGYCVDGTCKCIQDYSGQRCEIAPDQCTGVVCYNQGTCKAGVCVCRPNYSGPDCRTANNCAGKNCLNGGQCSNGICVCFNGYSGPNCELSPSTYSSLQPTTTPPTTSPLTSPFSPLTSPSTSPSTLPPSCPNVATLGGMYTDSSVGASSEINLHPAKDAVRPLTTVCTDEMRARGECSLSDVKYWMSKDPPPQWIAFDFGAAPRSICGLEAGARLKPEKIDSPTIVQIQYADSLEGDGWVIDPAMTAVAKTDHGVSANIANSPNRLPHRYWRLSVLDSVPRNFGKKFVVVRDLRMFECGCRTN